MKSVLSELDGVTAEDPSSIERIRTAALRTFGTHGTSSTSLRTVAEAAGVSKKELYDAVLAARVK